MADIVLSGLVKEFPGGVRALDKLDLTIADGEFFALLGPSGCGKTTLLRTIAGLEPPTDGTVHIGDRDVTRLEPGARDVAMVFQDYALFPHMTVSENIAYPLKVRRRSRAERDARAAEVGAQLGLDALLLPAGQRRRTPCQQRLQAELGTDLGGAGLALGARAPPDLQRIGDVLEHGHVRVERIVLEDHRQVAFTRRQRGDVALADPQRPLGRRLESGDGAQQRRLAATGRPEQGEELAVADRQLERIQRPHPARIHLRQFPNLNPSQEHLQDIQQTG